MRESKIEKRLVSEIENMGGKAYKFISPGNNGMPDRLIVIDGKCYFAETKAPGKRLRPLQKIRKAELESLGVTVFKVDSMRSVEAVLNAICPT